MHAWHKGNAFLALLEHKKYRAGHDKKERSAIGKVLSRYRPMPSGA